MLRINNVAVATQRTLRSAIFYAYSPRCMCGRAVVSLQLLITLMFYIFSRSNTLRTTSRSVLQTVRQCSALSLPNSLSIGVAHRLSSEWLHKKGVEDGVESARHILCHTTGIGTRFSDFNNHLDRKMTADEISRYEHMCKARADRTPVQYIIGNWDFYGLTLNCRPPILIPRPETEELVENVLNTGILQNIKNPRILDVGAGTGAIGLALLSKLPQATCYAIDLNPAAVALANENAAKVLGEGHTQRYTCAHADLRTFVREFSQHTFTMEAGKRVTDTANDQPFQPFDLIVSNPPYIPRARISTLQPEIRDYEDVRALDGGEDGLDMVRDLVYLAPTLLGSDQPGRAGKELWLEVSEEHPQMVQEWVQRGSYDADRLRFMSEWHNSGAGGAVTAVGATAVQGLPDLSGNPRFIRLKF